jgi:hypothetical protein
MLLLSQAKTVISLIECNYTPKAHKNILWIIQTLIKETDGFSHYIYQLRDHMSLVYSQIDGNVDPSHKVIAIRIIKELFWDEEIANDLLWNVDILSKLIVLDPAPKFVKCTVINALISALQWPGAAEQICNHPAFSRFA